MSNLKHLIAGDFIKMAQGASFSEDMPDARQPGFDLATMRRALSSELPGSSEAPLGSRWNDLLPAGDPLALNEVNTLERAAAGYPREVEQADLSTIFGTPSNAALDDNQRSALGVAGLGGAFGAGALALNRIRKARMAEEAAAAALASKGGGVLGKLLSHFA